MFDANKEIESIVAHMRDYFEKNNLPKKVVVGISGGKDSLVVAALGRLAFGAENVFGVLMPNGEQKDISDSYEVVNHLGIPCREVNIGAAYNALADAIGLEPNYQFKTNTPARIRMTTLYGIAALVGGVVLNTCNLSEDVMGYSTLYGDSAGSYAPIRYYTVTEVLAMGDAMKLPQHLVHKAPSDGMCGSTDEANLSKQLGIEGFTYARLDEYIRNDGSEPIGFSDEEVKSLRRRYCQMKYKLDIIDIPGPDPKLVNNFEI